MFWRNNGCRLWSIKWQHILYLCQPSWDVYMIQNMHHLVNGNGVVDLSQPGIHVCNLHVFVKKVNLNDWELNLYYHVRCLSIRLITSCCGIYRIYLSNDCIGRRTVCITRLFVFNICSSQCYHEYYSMITMTPTYRIGAFPSNYGCRFS